jgi:hypothetical protein
MRGSMLCVCIMAFVLAIVAYGLVLAPKPVDDLVAVSSMTHGSDVSGRLFEARGK